MERSTNNRQFNNGNRAAKYLPWPKSHRVGQIWIAAFVIATVTCGIFLYLQKNENSELVFLFGGRDFARGEIASAEAAFAKQDLNDFRIVGQRIQVPLAKRSDYVKAMSEAGAIPNNGLNDSKRFSVNPFMTSMHYREIQKSNKQDKIRAMIRQIQGIDEVLVEYDENRLEGFPKRVQKTAAVTVRAKNQQELRPYQVDTIRRTIENAVAGLNSENIVVIDGIAGRAYDKTSMLFSAEDSRFSRLRTEFEDRVRQKVLSLLSGYSSLRVKVEVRTQTNDESISELVSTKRISFDFEIAQPAQQPTAQSQTQLVFAQQLEPGSNRRVSIDPRSGKASRQKRVTPLPRHEIHGGNSEQSKSILPYPGMNVGRFRTSIDVIVPESTVIEVIESRNKLNKTEKLDIDSGFALIKQDIHRRLDSVLNIHSDSTDLNVTLEKNSPTNATKQPADSIWTAQKTILAGALCLILLGAIFLHRTASTMPQIQAQTTGHLGE